MTGRLKDIKPRDLLLGIVAPLIVCLVIIWFPLNEQNLMNLNPAFQGIFVFGVQEVIMAVAVPMIVGLMWNKWAGGATGFLMGSIYALWYGLYGAASPSWIHNMGLLGYLLSAMLIGYIAGALNKKSTQFPRLAFSGFTAALVGGLFLFTADQFASPLYVYGAEGFFITMTPRLIFGIVIPAIVALALRHSAKNMAAKAEAHT